MSVDNIIQSITNSVSGIATWLIDYIGYGFLSIMTLNFGESDGSANYLSQFYPFLEEITSICTAIAIALAIILFVFSIFKNFYSPPNEAQNPLSLIFRFAVSLLLIIAAPTIVNEVLYKPLGMVIELTMEAYEDVDIPKREWWKSLVSGLTDIIQAVAGNILILILQIAVFWNYMKLLLCALERWVVCGILYYTSPLAMAMGVSKTTENVLKSWFRMIISSCLILMLNLAFMYAYLSSQRYVFVNGANFGIESGSVGGAIKDSLLVNWQLMASWVWLAVLKVGRQVDQYMSSLGISVASTAQNLGGELLTAGAMLGAGIRGAGKAWNSKPGQLLRTKVADFAGKMGYHNFANTIRPQAAGNQAVKSHADLSDKESAKKTKKYMNDSGTVHASADVDTMVGKAVGTEGMNRIFGNDGGNRELRDTTLGGGFATAQVYDKQTGLPTGESVVMTTNKDEIAKMKQNGEGVSFNLKDGTEARAITVADPALNVDTGKIEQSDGKMSSILKESGCGGSNLERNQEAFNAIDSETGDMTGAAVVTDNKTGVTTFTRPNGIVFASIPKGNSKVNDESSIVGTVANGNGPNSQMHLTKGYVPFSADHIQELSRKINPSGELKGWTPIESGEQVIGARLNYKNDGSYLCGINNLASNIPGSTQIAVGNGPDKADTVYNVRQVSGPSNRGPDHGYTKTSDAGIVANHYAKQNGMGDITGQDVLADGSIQYNTSSGGSIITKNDEHSISARIGGDSSGASQQTYWNAGYYGKPAGQIQSDGVSGEKGDTSTYFTTKDNATPETLSNITAQKVNLKSAIEITGVTSEWYTKGLVDKETHSRAAATEAMGGAFGAEVSEGRDAAANSNIQNIYDAGARTTSYGRVGSKRSSPNSYSEQDAASVLSQSS